MTDIGTARDLLQGALQAAGSRTDSDWEEVSDDENNLIDIQEVRVSPTSSATTGSRRVRRRRKQLSASAFKNSYVMKLFDRSVDLARFPADASLYAVCHAWMVNDPAGQLPAAPAQGRLQAGTGETALLAGGDVHQLPPPEPRLGPPLRHPELLPPAPLTGPLPGQHTDGLPTRPALMSQHLTRWRRVRQLTKQQLRRDEQRYSASFRLLEELCVRPDRL